MIDLYINYNKFRQDIKKAKVALDKLHGKENTMKAVLNGVTMEGTPEQLSEVARKLGVELDNDGIWYRSESRGLIRIVDMDENHIKNTIAKRYREHFANLKSLEGSFFTDALQGPNDKTTNALVARLVEINYRKTYRFTRSLG